MSICILAAVVAVAGGLDVDHGRQLFVDDYVIESTNGIVRCWNAPTKLEGPIVRPTAENGVRDGACAVATDGGLWWDPTIARFRLWYEDNWAGNMRYAESKDGLVWERPDLGKVKGTNRVFSDDEMRLDRDLDSWSVWPNYKAANPYADWKMLVSAPGGTTTDTLFTSPDGRTFTRLGVAGYSGDRTTLHYDTILSKWVFSLRDFRGEWCGKGVGRSRRFHAQEVFSPGQVPYGWGRPSGLAKDAPTPAMKAPDIWKELELDFGPRGSLYNFDAVPYESLMLGVMEVLHNSPRDNYDCQCAGLPKQTSLRFAFSRDGRTYLPAPDSALKPSGWGSGKWDTGYLSAIGGICVIKDERLWFYYSAIRGDAELRGERIFKKPMYLQGMHFNGSIGAATLRRDGFCGMVADGDGELVTKPLSFTGSHLFVNAECLFGNVRAEILDGAGKVVPGFSRADCRWLKYVDRTKVEMVWKGASPDTWVPLGAVKVAGLLRIRFVLRCATIYSFWISLSVRGESRGYVAAGGPAYRGLRDE